MRLQHLERFQPVCPNCLNSNNAPVSSKLYLTRALVQEEDCVLEGLLQCSRPECASEFPIIDGIPIILSQLRAYVTENLLPILNRNNLSPEIESLIGDCCSQSSLFDAIRQHTSCYVWDHYGQFDTELFRAAEPKTESSASQSGSVVRLLNQFVPTDSASQPDTAKPSALPTGLTVDVGCSVGRNSFELASRTQQPVLGIDMNYASLRLAQQVLRTGRVDYALRRGGLVYERRTFEARFESRELVDFWACDVTSLPLANSSINNCIGFNLLDAVSSPYHLLSQMARVMQSGGHAVLACPYDWTISATPLENWIGGHSQRGERAGDPVAQLHYLLSLPELEQAFELIEEQDDLPWSIRLHDRSSMHYQLHGIRLKRK